MDGTRKRGSVNCQASKTDCQIKKEAGDRRSAQGTVGHFTPDCNPDGTYSKKQCHGSTGFCWCANPDGAEIDGTRIRFSEPNCDLVLGGGRNGGDVNLVAKCEEAKAKAEARAGEDIIKY